jgi:CHAT domain
MPRILFLTAGLVSGQRELRVGREARAVRAAIATVDADWADLRVEADVGRDELLDVLLAFMPDIVHFSGHGEPGRAHFENGPLSGAMLARMVAQVPQIWCVVLNSCYGETISQQLKVAGIPAVVGLTGRISDAAAIDFSRFFYRALAESPDIERAVEQSRANLQGTYPDEELAPVPDIHDRKVSSERSSRHARPDLRARFCVDSRGRPEVYRDAGSVFVSFDLYVKNPPLGACSAIYRLHSSYNEVADSPENGQFREIANAGESFYLGEIQSEDDYPVEVYIRWNDGRVKMLSRKVTEALKAHYETLSAAQATEERANPSIINSVIVGLENGNIPLGKPASRKAKAKQQARRRSR